jgi:hypothetical protein
MRPILSLILLLSVPAFSAEPEDVCENLDEVEEVSAIHLDHMRYETPFVISGTLLAGNHYESRRQFNRKRTRLRNIYGRPHMTTDETEIWLGGRENFPHYVVVVHKELQVVQLQYECDAAR